MHYFQFFVCFLITMERSIHAFAALLNPYPFHSILWILYNICKSLWVIKPPYSSMKCIVCSVKRNSEFFKQLCVHDCIFSFYNKEYLSRVIKHWLFVCIRGALLDYSLGVDSMTCSRSFTLRKWCSQTVFLTPFEWVQRFYLSLMNTILQLRLC